MPDSQPPYPPLSAPEAAQSRIEVHLAEYNALTTRITYLMTFSYAIYALAGAYLGFAIQARNSIPMGTLVWASLLVLQLLAWGMLQIQYEIFVDVDYIENHLKPRVSQVLGDNSFWGYESFQAKRRATGFTRFEFLYGFLGFFVLLIGAVGWFVFQVIRKTHWALADTLWAGANLYLAVIVVGKIVQNSGIQKRMSRPDGLIREA